MITLLTSVVVSNSISSRLARGRVDANSPNSEGTNLDNGIGFWNEVVGELLLLATLPTSGAELPPERLRAICMIFERGLLGFGRSERVLQSILKVALMRLSQNAADHNKRASNLSNSSRKRSSSSGTTSASDVDSVVDYNSTQVTMLLMVAGKAAASLGDAALGFARLNFVEILFSYSSTPSRMVRTEVASVCRTLMSALPSLGVRLLNLFVSSMAKDHANLMRLAATSRRKSPSEKERRNAVRIMVGLKGHSVSVAALLYPTSLYAWVTTVNID